MHLDGHFKRLTGAAGREGWWMWREGSVGDLVGITWNEEPMWLADKMAWSVKKSGTRGLQGHAWHVGGGAFVGLEDAGGLGLKEIKSPVLAGLVEKPVLHPSPSTW